MDNLVIQMTTQCEKALNLTNNKQNVNQIHLLVTHWQRQE